MSDATKEKDSEASGIKKFIAETKLFGLGIPQLFMVLLTVFILLAFIGVIKLSFGALAGVGIAGMLAYFYFQLVIVEKKSIDYLLEHDSAGVVKIISAASTFGEVIGLIIIATDVRGISIASALIRFGLIGTLELLFTFLFISVFHTSLYTSIGRALWGDKVVSAWEKIWITTVVTLKTLPFFLIATGVTNFIWILYLESIYNVELVIEGIKFWQFSIYPIQIEGYTQTPELAAWFMVFATPILNIVLVIFEIKGLGDKIENDEIPQVKPLHVKMAEKRAAAAAKKAATPPSTAPTAPGSTPPPSASAPGSTPPPSPPKKKEEYEPESVTGLFVAMYQYFCRESKENDFVRQDPLSDIISERYGILPKQFYSSSLYNTLVGQNTSLRVEELFGFITDVIDVTLEEYVKSMYAIFGISYEGDLFDKTSQIKVKLEKLPTTVDSYFNKLSTTSKELAVELHDVVFEKYQIKDGTNGTNNNKKIHLLISENLAKLEEYSKEFLDIKNKVSGLNAVNNAAEISTLETKKKGIINSSQDLLKNMAVILQLLHSECGIN